MDIARRRSAGEGRSCRVIAATIRCQRWGETPIVIRNISARGVGARIRSAAPPVGERVTLTIHGRSLQGEVRWVREGRFGVWLDEEVDPATFLVGEAGASDLQRPFGPGHVYDQFRPVNDSRRPGLKVR